MIRIREKEATKLIISMIEDADSNDEEISETQIREVLGKDPFNYKRNSVNDILNKLSKKWITKYKRGKENYYTRWKLRYRPYFMFVMISSFEIVFAGLFIIFYKYELAMERYYMNINNDFFINHHYVIYLILSVAIIMNLIIVLLWNKTLNKYKDLILRT